MKHRIIKESGHIACNESYEGKPLEYELQKVIEEKTPITKMSPEIFTERKQGVLPECDIRTDRWVIAHNSMEKVSQARIARREKNIEESGENQPAA